MQMLLLNRAVLTAQISIQIVVVASGTNDWHSVPPIYTLDQWLTKGAAFLQQVRDRRALYLCLQTFTDHSKHRKALPEILHALVCRLLTLTFE